MHYCVWKNKIYVTYRLTNLCVPIIRDNLYLDSVHYGIQGEHELFTSAHCNRPVQYATSSES